MATATMSPVTLRAAHYTDQARIASIFVQAFWDEALFGPIIHPNRRQYPADMALFALRRNRVNWWDWTNRFLVTTTTDAKTNREIVTGYARWARVGREGKRRWGLAWWDPSAWKFNFLGSRLMEAISGLGDEDI